MTSRDQSLRLERALEPLGRALDTHPIYAAIADLDSLRRFMEVHVFAVWDFMTLVKSLQRRLTSVEVLWRPPFDPRLARFVNEVVLCEESDVVGEDRCLSHLQLYLEAMTEIGADTGPVTSFLQDLAAGRDVDSALAREGIPASARQFVQVTLGLARGASHVTAAAFCYGREDPIPRMFERILAILDECGLACPDFRLYLERHCEVDGEEHGPMARRLLRQLCLEEEESWREARQAARVALEARIALWDAVADSLSQRGSLATA